MEESNSTVYNNTPKYEDSRTQIRKLKEENELLIKERDKILEDKAKEIEKLKNSLYYEEEKRKGLSTLATQLEYHKRKSKDALKSYIYEMEGLKRISSKTKINEKCLRLGKPFYQK